MEEKELIYYPYDMIEELVNADKSDITNMLFAMQILDVEKNPNEEYMFGQNDFYAQQANYNRALLGL
mgnify:CR=1 FL=1